jgi:predicted 3-demethylubiquinone-9 3-methyltransferase (glyoxalase superfamily)
MKKITQKIIPFLWFDDKAEEAMNFYVDVFSNNKESFSKGKDSKVLRVTYYDEASARASEKPVGSVMTGEFLLEGQKFLALNGGQFYKITPAISFVVNCETQEEIDYFWEKLSQGGKRSVCGWIESDKFGVAWQIVPIILDKMLADKDIKKSKRVMEAMLKMDKIIIEDLVVAYEGKDKK